MIIDMAKAVRLEDEIARRGIRLIGRGERVGPCPVCGGRDRFSINSKKQVWNCRGCGRGGDVIALVQHLDTCDFPTAIRTLTCGEREWGYTKYSPPISSTVKPAVQPVESDTTACTRALRLWDDASPIAGTLAEDYLRRRGLEPPEDDEALRYYGACPFGDARYSCMLGLFRSITTNEPKAITRIALGPAGIKIGKMMLGPVAGCAVKLSPDEDVEQGLAVAEGIETALGAMALGCRPIWAVGSAVAIAKFPVLAGVDALTIVTDHDKNGTGQRAAQECSERWIAAGRECILIIPHAQGADMADIVMRRSS
jgi:putative DNA primase/helicase